MTSHDPREPLDADERELAQRLSRLGPVDGPSPALDAKILAAARAAATPARAPSRRRWLAWASLPPAAITGMGVAAACVLALGVVWQMRPRSAMVPAATESEEVFVVAEPAGTRAPVDNPPPFEAAADVAAAPQVARVPATPPTAAQTRKASSDSAMPMPAGSAADARATDADAATAVAADASVAAAPAPEALAAGTEGTQSRADGLADASEAARTETAASKQRRATYTSAARATAERQRQVQGQAAAPPPPQAAPAPAREPEAFAQTAEAASTQPQDTELDKVVVTGSRIAANDLDPDELARIPVRQDATLGRDAWLVRIRARRDAQDLEAARESLRLFRREYPRVRLPDDLRSLAAAPAP